MKTYYKLFTVNRGSVTPGARVDCFTLEKAGVEIPALLLGGKGRGMRLGVVPVEGANPGDTIQAAALGRTRTGRPKLVTVDPEGATKDAVLLALKCDPGYRGRAKVTAGSFTLKEMEYQTMSGELMRYTRREYDPLPADWVLAEGYMGSGPHLLLLLPRGLWVRWVTGGRTYGDPWEWFYLFNGEKVIAVTRDERELLEDMWG